MNPKIQRIDIYPISLPLIEPFVISRGALTHALNTIVIIHSDQGVFGTGECCPYRSIHGETQEGSVVVAQNIAEQLIGKDPRKISAHLAMMSKVIAGNASIKCAFDMALYDLVSKLADVPLYTYLGADDSKKIYTDMTISLLEKEKMAEKALKYKEDGFPVLKVKLGQRPSSSDVARIESIRNAIGDELPLRIDANQGWNFHDASTALDLMKDLNIEHCEEPLPYWNLQDQIRLTSFSPIPIMADESVFHHHDAFRILSMEAATMINIKLGKSGGIGNAMKIAAIAEAADVYCQVGSFSESRLGITALTHFAHASGSIIHYDLDSPLMHQDDPVIGGMKYESDWRVTLTDKPGHGAQMDEAYLRRFTRVTVD